MFSFHFISHSWNSVSCWFRSSYFKQRYLFSAFWILSSPRESFSQIIHHWNLIFTRRFRLFVFSPKTLRKSFYHQIFDTVPRFLSLFGENLRHTFVKKILHEFPTYVFPSVDQRLSSLEESRKIPLVSSSCSLLFSAKICVFVFVFNYFFFILWLATAII